MAAEPGYWMNEVSGELEPAILSYLSAAPMSAAHIAVMRSYLRQWINAGIWDDNPHMNNASRRWLAQMRAAIDGLTTREAIDRWLDDAEQRGIDPL